MVNCQRLYRFKEPLAVYPSVERAPEGSSFVSEQEKHGGPAAISSHNLPAPKGEAGWVRDWLKSSVMLQNQYRLK